RKPLWVFQGAEDVVVPEAQTTAFVQALRARGVAVTYTIYPGEGHGWRNASVIHAYWQEIEQALDTILAG
ncbi:MAG TPA: prolyl oligopeptidase family serine peptidase, partial [Anaerolineales bacterium]|nr:prolyl oligopeptidase family serine peptidase [Anaerolineales bacterium]